MPKPRLPQKLTYWAPGAEDQFGGRAYSAPIIVKGRWEDRVENVIAPSGQQITSKSRIFTEVEIKPAGFVLVGEVNSADPLSVEGAQEIRVVGSMPNLGNLSRLWTAYV